MGRMNFRGIRLLDGSGARDTNEPKPAFRELFLNSVPPYNESKLGLAVVTRSEKLSQPTSSPTYPYPDKLDPLHVVGLILLRWLF